MVVYRSLNTTLKAVPSQPSHGVRDRDARQARATFKATPSQLSHGGRDSDAL